jgi:hypothetical protein
MERTLFHAGSTVPGGFYINREKLDLVVVGGRQGPLPADEGRYTHLPIAAALLLAPLFGGLYLAVAPCLALLRLARRLRSSTWPRLRRNGRWLASRIASWRRAKPAGPDEPPPKQDASP